MTLEFRIGQIYDPKHLGTSKTPHKYVLDAENNKVTLYASQDEFHFDVANRFDLKRPQHNIVGGGNMYKRGTKLILDGDSTMYGPVPKAVAQKFGRVVLQYLKRNNINVSTVEVNPSETMSNPYWRAIKI